jgi:branched-chain amino acid transport system permease protein
MDILLGAIVSGLLLGAVFALVALGLNIIFGVMDIVNFAHGEFLMLGMYVGWLTSRAFGVDPLWGMIPALCFGFTLGVSCYYGFVRFLLRGPALAQLLGTFGLMLLLRNIALMCFGPDERSVQAGLLVGVSFDLGMGVIVPATKLAAALLSAASFYAVWLMMNRTRVGKALVATSLNAQGARYMGIPTDRMNALAWGVGGGTVCLAGALLVNFWTVSPQVGILFTMIAFTVVALGGFGSIQGTFFAALVVGLITELPGFTDFFTYTVGFEFMGDWPMTAFKYTFIYLAYFLIVLLRPQGLFGWKR